MKIDQIKLKPGESVELLPSKIQKKTGKRVRNWRILKESIDARKKNDIRIIGKNPADILSKLELIL